MKYTLRFNFVVQLIAVLSLAIACQEKDLSVTHSPVDSENTSLSESSSYFVSEELATYAAEQFANTYQFHADQLVSGEHGKNKESSRTVDHVLAVDDMEGKPALYFVNYKNEGFAVISGDVRVNPIWAYSEAGHLPVALTDSIAGGLEFWLEQSVSAIQQLRTARQKMQDKSHNGWRQLAASPFFPQTAIIDLPPPSDGDGCDADNTIKGPFLTTHWGQGAGYNNDMPTLNCSGGSLPSNGRAYTGCVATAMAQVMRYHQYPANYNWNAMPDGPLYSLNQPYGTNDIAQLMYDAAESVDMTYTCNEGSYIYNEGKIASELITDFEYSSSTQIVNYQGTSNYDLVRQEFNYSRPVIFTGENQNAGHAWVSDGYKEAEYCDDDGNIVAGTLYFHMNWGWNNSSADGWYGFNNFNPDDTYNNNSKVVIGIKP